MLGIFGGALAIVLAAAGLRPFVAFWPGSLPRAEEVHLDWRVLLFAAAVSLLSGLGFGLDDEAIHAVQRIRFTPAMRDGKPVDFPARVRIEFRLVSVERE